MSPVASAMIAAGFDAPVAGDIRQEIWMKLIGNLSYNPVAALTLAQGSGRLLRRRSDRGVVAVLDPRLATRNYRRVLLDAMPAFRRTVVLEDACTALREAAGTVED